VKDLPDWINQGWGPLGVRFLQTRSPDRIIIECVGNRLPFNEVIGRVDCIHVSRENAKDVSGQVFLDGVSPWIVGGV